MVNRVTGFILMMAALYLGHGLIAVSMALVCGELAGLSAVWYLTRQFVVPLPIVHVAMWRHILILAAPLAAGNLLIALVNRLDTMMLEAMTGLVQVGTYGAAYRITSMLEKLPLLVMATLYPLMSRFAASDPAHLKRFYHRSLRNMALIAAVMVVSLSVLAPVINRTLTPDFPAAVILLRVLALSTACMYVAVVGGNLLIVLGRQSAGLWAWILAGPVNVVLNLILIPRYGALGAALATLASFLIVLVVVLVLAERCLRRATEGARGVTA